jgi:hypothetical protein
LNRPERGTVQTIPKSELYRLVDALPEGETLAAKRIDFIMHYDIKYRMGAEE